MSVSNHDVKGTASTKIEVRHLRYFVTVAEELNFARAAQRLHISQPPLTRQIRYLEKVLGVKLFNRTTRSVEMTAAGRAFLPEAQATLAQIAKGVDVAQRSELGEIGELIVAYEASSAYDLVPHAIKLFREKHPKVKIVLHSIDTDEQLDALVCARIEVGFVVPPVHHDEIDYETILSVPLIAVLPETHPLSSQRQIDLADLAAEPFILSERSLRCGLYDQVIAACRRAGVTPTVVQETHEMQMMLGFIAAGIGVTLLPEYVKDLRKPGVVWRPLSTTAERIELAVAWRRSGQSTILRAFLEIVRSCAKDTQH